MRTLQGNPSSCTILRCLEHDCMRRARVGAAVRLMDGRDWTCLGVQLDLDSCDRFRAQVVVWRMAALPGVGKAVGPGGQRVPTISCFIRRYGGSDRALDGAGGTARRADMYIPRRGSRGVDAGGEDELLARGRVADSEGSPEGGVGDHYLSLQRRVWR
jgi:hypothetical protein